MSANKYILLVEDDLAHAELVKRSFETYQFDLNLHVVFSLAEAYNFLSEAIPALVLTDFRLPDGEGTELLSVDQERANWPVIIMTSQGDEQLAVEALKAGALDYVVKSEETFINMPRIVERALREWQNISERRMAEKALLQRENLLAQAQRFAKFGSWELDVSTGVFQLSDGGYELLEIDSSKNFKTLEQAINYLKNNLAPDKIDDLYSQVQMAIQTGQSTQADIQMKLPSGKLIYHACQFNPVHDAQGHVQTIVGTFQDITDRTLSSKARKKAERELEEQRSLSMRSDRLRSLGEMSAGIAHELNQPLMGVRGLAEHIGIAIERGWDLPLESLKEQAGKIVEQADRMTHIIDHIRMFAREAAKPQSQPVSVNTVVDYAIDMLYAQFRSHGLSLVSDKVEDLPIVSANPFSIEEVLINLMINARHAVEEKVGEDQLHLAPEICVRTFQIDNDTVAIEVQDGGNGIPEDILDQVFDPFFTTKDPDKGTGLGLAISKSIVESFDGSIDIQSEPGQGTTVRISLPVSLPQTPAQ